MNEVRIDKWLWATRVFKTRSQAIDACRAGHIKINGTSVKPSRPVRVGETLTATSELGTRTFRVTGLPDRRAGPKLVPLYLEELTPADELARIRTPRSLEPGLARPKGIGRPTKKQRRALERFLTPPAPLEE